VQEYAASLADGTFVAGDVPLPVLGENRLQLVCTDAAGTSHAQNLVITRLAEGDGPVVQILAPQAGAWLTTDSAPISGTVSDATATVTVNGLPATVAAAPGSGVGAALVAARGRGQAPPLRGNDAASQGTGVGGGLATSHQSPATASMAGGGAGSFSLDKLVLTEGPNVIGARAIDGVGRAGKDRVVVWRDSQAPKVQISSPENGSSLGLAGNGSAAVDVWGAVDLTTEPNLKDVVVGAGQGNVVATVEPATGVFVARNVPLSASLPSSTAQVITATATDTFGKSATSTVRVYTVATGPAIVLSAPSDLAIFSEASDATIPITGEAWAADGAEISINGAALEASALTWDPAGADGRRHCAFSAAITRPTAEGSFGVIVKVTEPDGDAAQVRRLLSLDSTAPKVLELVPQDGATGVDGNSIVMALFSENVLATSLATAEGFTLTRLSTGEKVVGQLAIAGTAVAFVPAAELAAGERYTVRAGSGITDLVGHPLGATAEATFTVAASLGAAAPVVDPISSPLCATTLEVKGSTAPDALVRVRDGALSYSAFSDATGRFAVTVPISASGYHLLHVTASSRDGKETGREALVLIQVDCSAPRVLGASFDRTTAVITVTFSEAMDAATLTIGSSAAAVRLADANDPAATEQTGTLALSADGTLATIQLDASASAWWRERPVRLRIAAPAADRRGNLVTSFETVLFPGGSGGLSGGFLSGEAYDDSTGRPFAGASVRLYRDGEYAPARSVGAALAAAGGRGQAPPLHAWLSAQFVAETVTDSRGRYTMAGDVAAGRYVLVIEGSATTRVIRRLALEPSTGAVPFDARLTPLAAAASTLLTPASGGTASANGLVLTAAAAALPGAEPLSVRLTSLSGQGLPEVLPLGWTPVAAAELRLSAGATTLPEAPTTTFTGTVTLDLPLPTWLRADAALIAVRYDAVSGAWITLGAPSVMAQGSGVRGPGTGSDPQNARGGGGVGAALAAARRGAAESGANNALAGLAARVTLTGPGTVALLLADTDPATRPPNPEGAGVALAGSALPDPIPTLAGTLTLDPPVVAPTGRATAQVVARSADAASVWPSGLAVQAYLEEKLILSGGGQLLEAPFSADLLLYHVPATSSWEGAAEFTVSPSPKAAQVLLQVGYETISLYPFPEQLERGSILGPAGGTVTSPDGVELTMPESALGQKTVVKTSLLSTLPPVTGYKTLAAVRIDLAGQPLARAATLRVPIPAGALPHDPADPRIILAELFAPDGEGSGVRGPGSGEGSQNAWEGGGVGAALAAARSSAAADGTFARLTARTSRSSAGSGQPEKILAAPEPAGSLLPLDGIIHEGTYLVLEAEAPIGFATGFVRSGGGFGVAGAQTSTAGLGTADISRDGGRYAIPVSAGDGKTVTASIASRDESGSATISGTLVPGGVAPLDITIRPTPPEISAKSPGNGTEDQPVGTPVTITFSRALDPASVGPGTITLELANQAGQGTGAYITGALSLENSDQMIVFKPTYPLAPGWHYLASFHGGVRSDKGVPYAGAVPVVWGFSTSTVVAPGGQVHPERFHIEIPADGVARLWGEDDAVPKVQSGEAPWIIVPDIEGPKKAEIKPSCPADTAGGFGRTVPCRVGLPPAFSVTLSSRVWVKVYASDGVFAAEFRLGPFVTEDGHGFIAPPGETVTFAATFPAEGGQPALTAEVEAPAAAFDEPTIVRVERLDPASIGVTPPSGIALGAYLKLDFDGEAKETLRLRVQAPADAPVGAKVIIATPQDLPWGRKLRLLDIGAVIDKGGTRYLSNDPETQPEPALAPTQGSGARGSGTGSEEGVGAGLAPARGGAGTSPENARAGGTCAEAKKQGLSRCFVQSLFMEMSSSTTAAWFYQDVGASLAFATFGVSAPMSSQYSAFYNEDADTFVYVPVPHDWNAHVLLPVIVDTPLRVVQRDIATGWLLGAQLFDPITDDPGGLVAMGALLGTPPRPPRLVGSVPFDVVRFSTPAAGASDRPRLDISVSSDASKRVTLAHQAPFFLARFTGLELFDVSKTRSYGSKEICGDSQTWSWGPFAGSDEFMLVVAPGDVDATRFDRFELQFDQKLASLDGVEPGSVASLYDLGPVPVAGCAPGAQKREIPLLLEQSGDGARLVLTAQSALPAGHRFELKLVAAQIKVEVQGGSALPYPQDAPHVFRFATRPVLGVPIGSESGASPSLGDTDEARDMLRFGQLLLVGSATGNLLAVSTNDHSSTGKFALHAIRNQKDDQIRSFATDGHNRLIYASLKGSTWGIRAVRVEDAREAKSSCQASPGWASSLPCFDAVIGGARVAYGVGQGPDTTASEYLAAGTLPAATPVDIEILTQDESGRELGLKDFVREYLSEGAWTGLSPDDSTGLYTVDVELTSTYARAQAGQIEPSLDPATAKPPDATLAWRTSACNGEPAHDRYQRVTVDNLTTGQSWSIDIENAWPDGSGSGKGTVAGIKAHRNDRLRVRYNVRALAYVALIGSGVSVVDLNRFYHLPSPSGGGISQCGRHLAKYQGQTISWPDCAYPGNDPSNSGALNGLDMISSVAVVSGTGCKGDTCARGATAVDIFAPRVSIGVVHSSSPANQPGNITPTEVFGCLRMLGGLRAQLRDVALATDVAWLDRHIRGTIESGTFSIPADKKDAQPVEVTGDLLFASLGDAGIFVFDISDRTVSNSTLVGQLLLPGHRIFRLELDPVGGLLFAGGFDANDAAIIDVWPLRAINGGPGALAQAQPIATIKAPWGATNHLGVDHTGSGLLYTWGGRSGPLAVPYQGPQLGFAGLYRPAEDDDTEPEGVRPRSPVERPSAAFVPLGIAPVLVEKSDDQREEQRKHTERIASPAFRLRVALPAGLGELLTAKVQSLRTLPPASALAEDSIGNSAALPGGPGWPDREVFVTLRRIGSTDTSASGRFSTAYNLYESEETVLLLADPRARHEYRRQDLLAGSHPLADRADEQAQCRNCEWPSYLPDAATSTGPNDPRFAKIKQLLAGGRYVRAYLAVDPSNGEARAATEAALAMFAAQGANYPAPSGVVELAGWADDVPSPIQASNAEPAQNAAFWSPGEAGVSVALAAGEALLSASDFHAEGRALAVSLDRNYRSGTLGYGPLGAAGWHSALFAHLRENRVTGEVVYHDGTGSVYRFIPGAPEGLSSEYEADTVGPYALPKGLYLRLLKTQNGWRLFDRQHGSITFDKHGRISEISDRHRQNADAQSQGSTIAFRHDAAGQLTRLEDDLGRTFRLEYYDSGPSYGLLRKVTDWVDRAIEYSYDEARRLTTVDLPVVSNPVGGYESYSYPGASGGRPAFAYRYDPTSGGVTKDAHDTTAVLHGEFAQLRLADFTQPGGSTPRARFEYEPATGRVKSFGFPTDSGQNSSTASVSWEINLPQTAEQATAAPASQVKAVAPWGLPRHEITYLLDAGRVKERTERLQVTDLTGIPSTQPVSVKHEYKDDGRLERTTVGAGSPAAPVAVITRAYPDHDGAGVDRLALGNIVATETTAANPAAQGPAPYALIRTEASYHGDNLPKYVTDGLGRGIDLPVAEANGTAVLQHREESVGGDYSFDPFGRPTRYAGNRGGTDPSKPNPSPVVTLAYGLDAQGKPGAGLVERVEQGGSAGNWQGFEYDDAFNVKVRTSSEGVRSTYSYDQWGRVVSATEGSSSNQDVKPAVTQTDRAYDASGRLARERRQQDAVNEQGEITTRLVDASYAYNERDQVKSVQITHVGSPYQPGAVIDAHTTLVELDYDEHGRLVRERQETLTAGEVITERRYDEAGRVIAIQTLGSGERTFGYDALGRLSYRTDGHDGVWRGHYDAWGRLYREDLPTGAVIIRTFDQTGVATQESTFDRDPSLEGAVLLAQRGAQATSFGLVMRVTEALAADSGGALTARRVTETQHDNAGRPLAIWSGPANANGVLEQAAARREAAITYEPETGRVLTRSRGGAWGEPPLVEERYSYLHSGQPTMAPWPSSIETRAAVPGESELRTTLTATFVRDAFGRVLQERRSDGAVTFNSYDRSSGAVIRTESGAGAISRFAYDGRGMLLAAFRPGARGVTRYAYDLDGRLHTREVEAGEGTTWPTAYAYDTAGRVTTITHPDGASETFAYHPDDQVSAWTNRDGIEVRYTYDAGNRMIAAAPVLAAGAVLAGSLAPLDGGDAWQYDRLGRMLQASRPGQVDALVGYAGYDLGGRPGSETVGVRSQLAWTYDAWDNPITLRSSAPCALSPVPCLDRTYDTLDRLTTADLAGSSAGATWTWGGDRVYSINARGAVGISTRFGYIGGAGPQSAGVTPSPDTQWQLGAITFGVAGATAPTDLPEQAWGQLGLGYRSGDAIKIGRAVVSAQPSAGWVGGLLTGMGWSWQPDGGLRLQRADAGQGRLDGSAFASALARFRYSYGKADQLERIVEETTGAVAELEWSPEGRITARSAVPFAYDASGRRTEDDRFTYTWDWRGRLAQVDVKTGHASPTDNPNAGQRVTYAYDAMGRLLARTELGAIPQGGSDAERPFVAKREYLWEGSRLAAETGLNFQDQAIWRITYLPGPGLDDAVQVRFDTFDPAGSTAPATSRTFTTLRDELGSVLALVEDPASQPPAPSPEPRVLVRYLYTPYGEAHAETGPEIRTAVFDQQLESVDAVTQAIADPATHAAGGVRLGFSLPLDEATLATGIALEKLSDSGWITLASGDCFIGANPAEPEQLVILPLDGWQKGIAYRITLTSALADHSGRSFADAQTLDLAIPASSTPGVPILDRVWPLRYDSIGAASSALAGAFQGGQPSLFQGLWTDPTTGIAYARNRWYDARNASWLSEDPMQDVDSPNLYAFVAWQPQMASDPMGECLGIDAQGMPCSVMADKMVGELGRRIDSSPSPPGMKKVEKIAGRVMLLPVTGALSVGSGLGKTYSRISDALTGHAPQMRNEAELRREMDAAAMDFTEAVGDVAVAVPLLRTGGRLTGKAIAALVRREAAEDIPVFFRPGQLLPDGRLAGEGPGAALANGPEFSVEQGRDALGRFLPKSGGELKPGSAAEEAVWDAVRQKPGWQVIEGRVSVRDATGQLRIYDGAAVSLRGRVIGLEVKSGGATRTAAQRAFDLRLNLDPQNVATGVGQSSSIVVQRSLVIRR
jgi:RHS repeat-associated protein